MLTIDEILAVKTDRGAPMFTREDALGILRLGMAQEVDDILLPPILAARYLGISRSTLRNWRRWGIVPAWRIPGGSRPLFRLGDLRSVQRPRVGNPNFQERTRS